jgi:hypothetical protein
MTNDMDVLKEFAEMLADVEPSPNFGARVRQRIDAAPRRRISGVAWRHVFLGGVATGLTAALVILAMAGRPHAPVLVDPGAVPPPVSSAGRSDTGLAPSPARTLRPRADARMGVALAPSVVDEAPTVGWLDGHEVIVPVDERAALGRLLRHAVSDRSMGFASFAPVYDKDGLLLPPAPIAMVLLPDLSMEDVENGGSLATARPSKDKR